MAKREVVILTDDLDDTQGDDIETVQFGFDGAQYEIDLTKANRSELERLLTPYLNNARRAAGSSRRKASGPAAPQVTQEDREYLRKNGFPDVKDRGRLSTVAHKALANR